VRIGALDLGTNSFHLLVAEVSPEGGITPLVREKEMLRLGDVVSREGRVPPEDAERAVACVRRMCILAERAGAREVLARATSAFRSAENGAELCDRIEAETGVVVEVISGIEEARLIFSAIRASVVLEPAPALAFDLGGGSLEVMVGDAGGLAYATSVNLGVGRLTAELVREDPPSKGDAKRLRERMIDVLAPVALDVAAFEPKLVIGSSGTLEDLAHMVAARREADVPISLNQLSFTRDEFLPLHEELMTTKAADRRRIQGLDARRVDLIPAGSMFLATAMELFDFEELTVSEWALREGIVLDALRAHAPEDWSDDPRAIRRASVFDLARRCNWPAAHSREVARLALQLFDGTRELHGLDDSDRELLEDASFLHDIGEHVSTDGHHKHGAYLVEHGGLRGFDPEEVHLLAAIVRWHRRGEPKTSEDRFGALDAADQERVRILVALLRIADGLDRGRTQVVDRVDVRVTPSLVLLGVRARGNVELELWGARRKRELFERIFGRELELTTHPAGSESD